MKQKPRDWLAAHVDHQGDECLSWPFYLDRQGYPKVWIDKKLKGVLVVMCRLAHGKPPTAKHRPARTCGGVGSSCVNPQHIRWRTESEIQSAANDRHRANGTYRPGRWKLTRAQVDRIRELKGKKHRDVVATMFGIDRENVRRIWLGRPYHRSLERERVFVALQATAAPMSAAAIQKAAGCPTRSAAATLLSHMTRQGEIVRFAWGRYRAPLTTALMRKITAAVRSAVPVTMPREMRDEVIQEMLLAFMEGTASLERLPADVKKALRNYWRSYPGKFGPLSLDAPVRGGRTLGEALGV